MHSKRLISSFIIAIGLCLTVAAKAERIELVVTEKCPYVCGKNQQKPGVLIEVIQKIFKRADITTDFHYQPKARALAQANSVQFDGIVGVLQRNAPHFIYPDESIGEIQYTLYTLKTDDWVYTGLNSLASRHIGVENKTSYGIFDSYLQRHSNTSGRVNLISGSDVTKRNVELLRRERVNLVLLDKHMIEHNATDMASADLKKAGFIPPDNLYVGFSPHIKRAQQYADIITAGMRQLRQSGELTRILASYGMTDWTNQQQNDFAPFTGDYIGRLESTFSYDVKRIDQANIIFESATAIGGGYWQYATEFKNALERLSKGKLTVELKFGVTDEHNIVMNVAEGKSHMGMIAINNITPFAPSLGFFALPYMFPSEAKLHKLLNDPLMDTIAYRAALESNVRPLSFFIGGYRKLANSVKPVRTTNDLQGLRIRVPRNQLMLSAFRAWGIEAKPLAWTELWPALESGLVDGQENPMNIIFDGVNRTQEVWDVLRYVTNIRYFMFTAPHIISEPFYRQLSPESQSYIKQAADEAEAFSWAAVKKSDEEITAFAKSKGMAFIDPIDEAQDWQAKARAIWPQFYYRVGGKQLVDDVLRVIEGSPDAEPQTAIESSINAN